MTPSARIQPGFAAPGAGASASTPARKNIGVATVASLATSSATIAKATRRRAWASSFGQR